MTKDIYAAGAGSLQIAGRVIQECRRGGAMIGLAAACKPPCTFAGHLAHCKPSARVLYLLLVPFCSCCKDSPITSWHDMHGVTMQSKVSRSLTRYFGGTEEAALQPCELVKPSHLMVTVVPFSA